MSDTTDFDLLDALRRGAKGYGHSLNTLTVAAKCIEEQSKRIEELERENKGLRHQLIDRGYNLIGDPYE